MIQKIKYTKPKLQVVMIVDKPHTIAIWESEDYM